MALFLEMFMSFLWRLANILWLLKNCGVIEPLITHFSNSYFLPLIFSKSYYIIVIHTSTIHSMKHFSYNSLTIPQALTHINTFCPISLIFTQPLTPSLIQSLSLYRSINISANQKEGNWSRKKTNTMKHRKEIDEFHNIDQYRLQIDRESQKIEKWCSLLLVRLVAVFPFSFLLSMTRFFFNIFQLVVFFE